MMNILRKYSGVMFFYLAVIGMLLLVSARFTYLENNNETVTYAMND